MKAVTLALLLMNLTLFSWLYTHPQSYRPNGVTHTTGFPASVEPLVLLRERPKTTEAAAEERLLSTEREQAAETLPAGEALAKPDEGASASVPMDVTDNPAAAQATDTPGSAPVPGSAVIETATVPDAAPVAADVPPVVTTPERICQTLGPFPSRAQGDQFVSQLVALDRESAVRTSQIEQPSGYWVYLPSMPHAEAQRIIDDLSAKGVKDYFLGRQNFISLGVFSDKRSAEARVRDISALGYSPRLEPRFLTREVFWVDLEESSAQRLDDAQWASLLKDQADIRRQTVACE